MIQAVTDIIIQHLDEAVKLGNFCQSGLREVLGRQRRDYGLSDDFPPEHPIDDLSDKARENAPTHNLGMESLCGLGWS